MPKGTGRPGTARREQEKARYYGRFGPPTSAPIRFGGGGNPPLSQQTNLANKARYPGRQVQRNQNYNTALVRYTGAGPRATYQAPKVNAYGRTSNYVDPALLQRVMNSQPNNLSGAFEKYDMYQGEDFINYLYNEGIVPHFTTQGLQGVPRSGRWTDYLLTKMGVTSYGVNPYALPYPQQQQPASYGGGGGGGGEQPKVPKPKQYGTTQDERGYNPADWLKEMVVWNI